MVFVHGVISTPVSHSPHVNESASIAMLRLESLRNRTCPIRINTVGAVPFRSSCPTLLLHTNRSRPTPAALLSRLSLVGHVSTSSDSHSLSLSTALRWARCKLLPNYATSAWYAMSFGYSISDVISLTQIAWTVVQNSRKACGEHDELTHEVSSLHVVLKRLQREVAKPENPVNKPGDSYWEELEFIARGCHRVLKILDQILKKYNALSEVERSGRKLWQKIKFGNGQMADLADYRSKVVYYTSAMSLWLNMVSIGTMGSVEKQMNDAGGDLKEIKEAVNGIAAHLMAKDRSEGSVLTAYPDDDKAIWKELRRELIGEGFSSSIIGKHKHLIKAYIEELGTRGLLDDPNPQVMNEPTAQDRSFTEDASQLVTFKDAGTADSQSSDIRVADGKGRCIQTTAETNLDPLLFSGVQSDADRSSIPNSTSDTELQIQPKEEDIVAAPGVISVTETQEDFNHTTFTKGPRQSSSLETLLPMNPNIQCSFLYASTFSSHTEEGLSGNSEGAYAKAEAPVQATKPISQNSDSFPENASLDSPAEMLRVVFNVWSNEYLLTSRDTNIDPPLGAYKTLRSFLLKLNAVDLEAIGWSNELKACRTSLIKQLNLRLGSLERRRPTPRRNYLICEIRCLDNGNSVKDIERKLLSLSSETHDSTPPKGLSTRLSTERQHQASVDLHRVWHDHHDRIAPLCIEWAKMWRQGMWKKLEFRRFCFLTMELPEYIESMRMNKQIVEPLNFYGDAELAAHRQLLMDDIKMMVSSIRMLKSDPRWKWKTLDLRTKRKGQRLIIDISWLKNTVICSLGTKCGFCPAA